ncbi:MAG: AAA family ATPase, partial [Myxococcales bacterium]|nr:AAA family ATPase [Myxococcales bacterium]
MRIKRLELHGFKSFVDRTTLVFPRGLTVVVGPNGCGKSNLVDAIRWAMGEMGARKLRGKSLEDVIFNGSESRKPLGMAEVSVIFDNAEGNGDLGAFASSPEIQVTRRLYRNGDSEYLLNRVPCRLKDIVTLFLDTGVGRDAYSIIEQGRVDALVNSKPTDRRIVFEEVAGIHKYRHRREEAQRKMESTTQNLLRVSDILEEVERRMRSLKRQAGKAERYKAARAEMRELDLALSSRRFVQASRELDEAQGAHQKAVARVEDLSIRTVTEEAAADRERETVHEQETRLHACERAVHELDARIAQGEQRLNFLRREVAGAEETVERERREHDELEGRVQSLGEEHAGLLRQQTELAEALAQGRARLADCESTAAEAGRRAVEFEHRTESHKSAVVDLMSAAGRLGSRVAGFESRREELTRRAAAAEAERERIEEQRRDLEARSSGVNEALAQARSERDQLREDLARVEAALAEAIRDAQSLETERSAAKDRLADRASRLASLRELEARFEGLGRGVQTILKERRTGAESTAQGVLGLVAEYVDAPKAFEIALEAVLGNRAEAIVVEARDQGLSLARHLRERDAGRAVFVAFDARAELGGEIPPAGVDGVVGRLRDLVEVRPEAADLADALFGEA